ncbi:MAG: hypothetical protein QMC98_03725 [Candidatus Thermoplasmatota archaeon]|nr:hypothetical protein [Candidatus Thermoplasmatota archaeon]
MQIPNKHGSIESMPLKLVIISVITSITIPALWSAYNSYSNIQLENNLKFEIHKITSVINQVYLGANGTSLKLEINLRNIEHLKLGDSLGAEYSTVIRYKLKGGSEQVIPVSEDVQIASGENTALTLYSGSYTLLFTHINYDINGDNKIGINERYVEAKIIM